MAITNVIHEAVLGCKSIGLDEHAVKRMTERGVSEAEILDVLRSPDRTGLPTQNGRFRYRNDARAVMWMLSLNTTRRKSSRSR